MRPEFSLSCPCNLANCKWSKCRGITRRYVHILYCLLVYFFSEHECSHWESRKVFCAVKMNLLELHVICYFVSCCYVTTNRLRCEFFESFFFIRLLWHFWASFRWCILRIRFTFSSFQFPDKSVAISPKNKSIQYLFFSLIVLFRESIGRPKKKWKNLDNHRS